MRPSQIPESPTTQNIVSWLPAYSAIGILITAIVVSLVAALPLYHRLTHSEEHKLLYAVQTRIQTLEELLSNSRNVAAQIASRTKAREALEEYNRGELDQPTLDGRIGPILGDALLRDSAATGISRLDSGGRLAVSVGESVPEIHWVIPAPIRH